MQSQKRCHHLFLNFYFFLLVGVVREKVWQRQIEFLVKLTVLVSELSERQVGSKCALKAPWFILLSLPKIWICFMPDEKLGEFRFINIITHYASSEWTSNLHFLVQLQCLHKISPYLLALQCHQCLQRKCTSRISENDNRLIFRFLLVREI